MFAGLQIHILTAYAMASAGALAAALIMRVARSDDDAVTSLALRDAERGLLYLAAGLSPAAFGEVFAAQLGCQWLMAAGPIVALVYMARGLRTLEQGQFEGGHTRAMAVAAATLSALTMSAGPRIHTIAHFVLLSAGSVLIVWQARGFVLRRGDKTERTLGVVLSCILVSSIGRVIGFAMYDGPRRVDLLYMPEGLTSLYAVLYGVLPVTASALVLNVINTRLSRQLRTRAELDDLTELPNRRALRELGGQAIDRARLASHEVFVALLDIDHFKRINDEYGHATGDQMLKLISRRLRGSLRPDALLARYGGEEFVAVIPCDGVGAARRIVERLRESIEQSTWRADMALPPRATVSIGLARVEPHETMERALTRADEALYRAKHAGRNQCQIALAAA